MAHTDVKHGLSDLIVPFLDIGKEGELQGQIKSIVRDLEIMLGITNVQRESLDKLEKAMAHISRQNALVDVESMHGEAKSNVEELEDMLKSAGDISASVGLSMRPCDTASSTS